MKIYALPLCLALILLANWAYNDDSDGRRTGGGGGGVSARSVNASRAKRQDSRSLRLQRDSELLRRRRAVPKGVYLIGHQYFAKRGEISKDEVCGQANDLLLGRGGLIEWIRLLEAKCKSV